MKKNILLFTAFILSFITILSACGSSKEANENISNTINVENNNSTETIKELQVRFGDMGIPFTLHLYDNDTAKTITSFVGLGDLRLPIYHYDGYDNWEVMQYYDIPSKYEIPQNPETITLQKAGEVYFEEGIPKSKYKEGIGIQSILRSVNIYHGEIDFKYKNHIFLCRILIGI